MPEQPNTWALLDQDDPGGIILRLGASEFFFEHGVSRWDQSRWPALASELLDPVSGVYPVLREDRALSLEGSAAATVLLEVCSFDFAGLLMGKQALARRAVVMTLMVGIAVMVVAQGDEPERVYRIWCDPSYGESLQAALLAIVTELP